MDDRRHVCFVLPSLNGGGAERAAVHVLNGLDAATWRRSMFLFERTGPYLADVDRSIEVHASASPSRGERWQALRRFVQEHRPDVIMAFLSFATTLSAARAAQTGAKVVFNQQTPMSAFLNDADYAWGAGWRRVVFSATSRLTYGAADLIIATSRGVADDLTANFGIAPDSIKIVPNPVDVATVRARAAEPIDAALLPAGSGPLVVAAGRLADAKNYPLLVDAFAILRQRVPARLAILGSGELEAQLREQIAARALSGCVTLLGFQPNPWQFIARAQAFVLTSHYEGFGNVLIEAMACGVPVVATASAGTRDIITNNGNGFLVESHTPAAVADALSRLLTDEPTRDRMATTARDSARGFDVDRVIASYDAALRQVAA